MSSKQNKVPIQLNNLLVVGIALVHVWLLIGLPLILFQDGAGWLASALIWFVFIPAHWALLHEAIHKLLHPNRAINEAHGRLLGILLFTPFDGLRFGHLMHHKFNRQLDSEYYDTSNKSRLGASVRYFFHLCGGLYLIEVFAPIILAMAPRRYLPKLLRLLAKDYRGNYLAPFDQAAQRYFVSHKNHLSHLRVDCVLSIALFISTCFAYGHFWPMFVALTLLRGFIVSFHDNVYHYATPLNNTIAAKELALPNWASAMFLHFNYHASHHAKAGTPWIHLPCVHAQLAHRFDEPFVPAIARQLQGPIALDDFTGLASEPA